MNSLFSGRMWPFAASSSCPVLNRVRVRWSGEVLQTMCFAACYLVLLSCHSCLVLGVLVNAEGQDAMCSRAFLFLSGWKTNCDFFFWEGQNGPCNHNLLQALVLFQLFLVFCCYLQNLVGGEEISLQDFQPWAGRVKILLGENEPVTFKE